MNQIHMNIFTCRFPFVAVSIAFAVNKQVLFTADFLHFITAVDPELPQYVTIL